MMAAHPMPPTNTDTPVEPEVVPSSRPWPWAGRATPELTKFTRGQRMLMTFFYVVSIAMVVAIIVVAVLTLGRFGPPL